MRQETGTVHLVKMWHSGAKIKWRGAAVVLMPWLEKSAEKRREGVKIKKAAHFAVARTKKRGAGPALYFRKPARS